MSTKSLVILSLGFFLVTESLPPPAEAGRYVLNQTPATIQRYFGHPLSQQIDKNNKQVIYSYSTKKLRRLFPKFPKSGIFTIVFVNNRAQSLNLDQRGEGFDYGQKEAGKFFTYIFGYKPPIWKPIQLPNNGGGHEGFIEYKACLGDGVATDYADFQGGSLYSRLYYDPLCESP
jgi:hypothetical protein